MDKVLVLFSGGKDSMLSTMLLLEQGYQVVLVHYSHALEIGSNHVKTGFQRLVKKYGGDKVEYLGVKKIDGIFREFICDLYNWKMDEIVKKYGNISISQLNCLSCRLSMYVETILLCRKLGISYVADGARTSQLFAIEQNKMLALFTELFKKYHIEFLLPVKDLQDDFQLKNEFLVRGMIPKVNESQCLMGMPLKQNSLDEETINTAIHIYRELFLPKIDQLIERYQNTLLGDCYL